MIRQEEVYKIGKIGKPHGVKGELTLFFDDDVFDRVDADYLVLLIDGILVPFYMEEWRFKSGETALVKFEDIDTKEEASEIVGSEVYFPQTSLRPGRRRTDLGRAEGIQPCRRQYGRNHSRQSGGHRREHHQRAARG